MKLRLGAAVLLAALTPLTAVTAQPAQALIDTEPPPEGSCHDLTWREGFNKSDPDPAVACSAAHTSFTYKVVEFDNAPAWNDDAAMSAIVRSRCSPPLLDALGGNAKAVQLSAASGPWWFMPTKAQRDAGASWIRCDLTVSGGDRFMPLPADPTLSLPLPDSQAKCRQGKRVEYRIAACARPHQYRATHALKYPATRFPGSRTVMRWTARKCSDKLGRSFGYYEWPNKSSWRQGYKFSVCYKTTRN